MKYELIAIPEKKKSCIRKMSKGNYQIGVYFFFLKAFSLFRWIGPALVCLIQLTPAFILRRGVKGYEWAALAIKCLVLFAAFSFGKWLLRFLVDKISGGMSIENQDERVVIDLETNTLSYSFRKGKHQGVEQILLNNIQIKINEDVHALSFTGVILCYEKNKNGSLSLPREKRSEILVDYYNPDLIETLQKFYGGE